MCNKQRQKICHAKINKTFMHGTEQKQKRFERDFPLTPLLSLPHSLEFIRILCTQSLQVWWTKKEKRRRRRRRQQRWHRGIKRSQMKNRNKTKGFFRHIRIQIVWNRKWIKLITIAPGFSHMMWILVRMALAVMASLMCKCIGIAGACCCELSFSNDQFFQNHGNYAHCTRLTKIP